MRRREWKRDQLPPPSPPSKSREGCPGEADRSTWKWTVCDRIPLPWFRGRGRGGSLFVLPTNYSLQPTTSLPTSIPPLPIDHIPEGFAGEVAAEVVGEEVDDVVADVGG